VRFDRYAALVGLKRLVYGDRGEPYRVGDHLLRFVPGTRPVKLRYASSTNSVNRYDALQIRRLMQTLGPGDVAIDVGAHHGQDALIMAALCGASGRVAAFEPDPHARRIMERNFRLNPETRTPRIEAAACSDRPGRATLYSRGGNANSALVATLIEQQEGAELERFEVPTVTLDAWIASSGWPWPRLVKIDAEGAEIGILRGARKLMASDSIILCELHPYAWPGFGDLWEDLLALASEGGRRLRYLDQPGWISGEPVYGIAALERA
jgi:FkbM family methyltransferase